MNGSGGSRAATREDGIKRGSLSMILSVPICIIMQLMRHSEECMKTPSNRNPRHGWQKEE